MGGGGGGGCCQFLYRRVTALCRDPFDTSEKSGTTRPLGAFSLASLKTGQRFNGNICPSKVPTCVHHNTAFSR